MAHRTRKRLTKTELKKDPINEALLKGMAYLQEHLKQFVVGGVLFIIGVLVVQSLIADARKQNDECTARYFLAFQLYQAGMDELVRYGDVQGSMGHMQMARSIAGENYRTFPGKTAGRRSLILASKIGIMLRLENEVIPELQSLLASDPGEELKNSAMLHLAVALENRGGGNDLQAARELYSSILERVPEKSIPAWESYSGLSRIDYAEGDYNGARENLESALSIISDTTRYVRYQLSRIDMASGPR